MILPTPGVQVQLPQVRDSRGPQAKSRVHKLLKRRAREEVAIIAIGEAIHEELGRLVYIKAKAYMRHAVLKPFASIYCSKRALSTW